MASTQLVQTQIRENIDFSQCKSVRHPLLPVTSKQKTSTTHHGNLVTNCQPVQIQCYPSTAYQQQQSYPNLSRSVILLVLEYAPGGELFELIYYSKQRENKLNPMLARTYFHELCGGIGCMHSLGIVHRDIKPQNLLLDATYNLKLNDFGLAKIVNTKGLEEGKLKNARIYDHGVGTPGYQAPEIVDMAKRLRKGNTI